MLRDAGYEGRKCALGIIVAILVAGDLKTMRTCSTMLCNARR